MNLVLKLLSSSFLKSKLFKNVAYTVVALLTLYYLLSKYHFSHINELESKIEEQEEIIVKRNTTISNLQIGIESLNYKFKNKIFECENNHTLKNLNNELKRIDNEKTPDINTNIGTYTITI